MRWIRSLALVFTVSLALVGGCKEKSTQPTFEQVAKPQFSIPGGTYQASQTVSITCATLGVTIRYTTDGSEPNSAALVYQAPISITHTSTIKAKAYRDGYRDSETAATQYVIDIQYPENFVFVEGGTFNNGSSDVTVSSFYIDKYEVTQAGYEAVMGVNPSHFSGNPNRPVEQVSWFNAIEYCNRRSMQEGLTPCFSYGTFGTNPDEWPTGWNTDYNNHINVSCNWTANGYRLPTEMEWMFAAKGGNHGQGYTYSGSDDIDAVAWYWGNSDIGDGQGRRTHDVGLKATNELGTFDMSGNVWEWVWDIYGSYPGTSQTNPTGADSGFYRVERGGGWQYDAISCTVSSRYDLDATDSYLVLGFRLVRRSP